MRAKQSKRSSRRSRKRASSYQLVYTIHIEPKRGEAKVPNLPKSQPIKLNKLLKEKTGSTFIRGDKEVFFEIFDRIQAQQAELLTALRLDSAKPDYAQAFLELARIHHGVGVILVENARPSNKNAGKWTDEQDQALVKALHQRRRSGMTITAALREIANEEGIWRKFPLDKSSRSEKPAASLRAQTLKKRLEIVRLRAAESSLRELLAEIGSRRLKPQRKSKDSSGDRLGKSKSSKS